jgi:hypothetical protein
MLSLNYCCHRRNLVWWKLLILHHAKAKIKILHFAILAKGE